jgi:AraC family transcriptional regulator
MSMLDHGQTFGQVAAGPSAGVTLSLHAPDQRLAEHEHACAYVCVVLSGGFRERSRGGEAERRAGEIIVHPVGDRHGDAFGAAGALCLNLHLAGVEVEPLARRAGPGLAGLIQALAAETARGAAGDRLEAEALSAEILDGLKDAAARGDDGCCIDRVLQALDDAPAHDWSLTALAEIAGRHPTHLARAFRRRTGLTLGAYRRRRRLTRLCIDLRFGSTALSELALEHGYADQAHMSREFRGFIGQSPAAWRNKAR